MEVCIEAFIAWRSIELRNRMLLFRDKSQFSIWSDLSQIQYSEYEYTNVLTSDRTENPFLLNVTTTAEYFIHTMCTVENFIQSIRLQLTSLKIELNLFYKKKTIKWDGISKSATQLVLLILFIDQQWTCLGKKAMLLLLCDQQWTNCVNLIEPASPQNWSIT